MISKAHSLSLRKMDTECNNESFVNRKPEKKKKKKKHNLIDSVISTKN